MMSLNVYQDDLRIDMINIVVKIEKINVSVCLILAAVACKLVKVNWPTQRISKVGWRD